MRFCRHPGRRVERIVSDKPEAARYAADLGPERSLGEVRGFEGRGEQGTNPEFRVNNGVLQHRGLGGGKACRGWPRPGHVFAAAAKFLEDIRCLRKEKQRLTGRESAVRAGRAPGGATLSALFCYRHGRNGRLAEAGARYGRSEHVHYFNIFEISFHHQLFC